MLNMFLLIIYYNMKKCTKIQAINQLYLFLEQFLKKKIQLQFVFQSLLFEDIVFWTLFVFT